MARRGYCAACRRRYAWDDDLPLEDTACPTCWTPLEASGRGKAEWAQTAAVFVAMLRRRLVDRSSRARRQEIHRHDRAVVRRNEPRWRKEDGAL